MKVTFTRLGYAILTVITVMFLLLSLARLATPWLTTYKTQLEQYASNQIGMPVKIQEIQAGWYYFDPVIHLSQVEIMNNTTQESLATIDDIGVGVNLLSSLLHWSFQPGVLIVTHANVHLNPTLFVSTNKPTDLNPLIKWIFQRKKVVLKEINVGWTNTRLSSQERIVPPQKRPSMASTLPPSESRRASTAQPSPENSSAQSLLMQQGPFKIENLYLKLKKGFFAHSADIQLDWLSTSDKVMETPTHLSIFVKFSADKPDLKTLKGNFLVSAENIHLSDWKERAMPYLSEAVQKKLSAINITQGNNTIQWYGNFDKGQINHSLEWHTKNIHLDLPNAFNQPLVLSSVQANVNWNSEDKKLNIEQFFIDNPQISAKTTGTLNWSEDSANASPYLNSETQFVLNDLVAIKKYLPYKTMNNKLSAWLSQSIVGGDLTTGKMIIKGHLSDFPFDKMPEDKGLFLVDSHWENFSLNYKPGWPAGKLMNAHIIFKDRDLSAEITGGTIDQLPLTDVKAQILGLGLGQELLTIQGHLQTNAANARHFVLNSELKKQLKSFNSMSISGPAIFDIDLKIPLYPEATTQVDGKATFLDGNFVLPEWWNLHFEHFKGWLTYDEKGIVGSNINTVLLNYPLNLQMKTVTQPQIATQVNIVGKIGIDALKKLFNVFVFDFMKGSTSYTAQLLLTPSPLDQDTLTMNTDLKGIAINLPKPYAKKTTESQPLSLSLNFSDVMNTLVSIHYENLISIHLDYNQVKKAYQFQRGKIHLGNVDKTPPTQDGLKIEGSLPEFTLTDWWPFIIKMREPHKKIKNKTQPQKKRSDIVLELLELNIGKIDIHGILLHKADVKLSEKNHLLNIIIKSDEVTGELQIPETIGLGIKANLDSLTISSQNSSEKNMTTYQPKDIPPLDLTINRLLYDGKQLGKLKLNTSPDEKNNAIIVKKLNLQAPGTTIDLNGSWSMVNGRSNSQVLGYIASNNIQQTVNYFGITPVMSGKKGYVSFNFNWPESFKNFSGALLNGLVNFKIDDGVITHLNKATQDKIGMGQLLGLLSPANLLKSLTFNFKDLSSKGLSFDTFKGNFAVNKGRMTTNNTEIDSSVAFISMKGTIDLGLQTYNLLFNIAPHTTGSLPIIATIAGGPIVGLATYAASALINQGMKHSSMYSYRVTGPWKNPKVEDANGKK